MFKNLIFKYRIKKYIRKWQKDISYIEGEIKEYDAKNETNVGAALWGVVLVNEIYLIIKNGVKISWPEIQKIADEKKFPLAARNYLTNMVQYLNLLKS